MLPLASFTSVLPSWRTVKTGLVIAVVLAAFAAGWTVQGWRYKAQENRAWQAQVDSMREQAKLDRADLERINEARAKADADAIKYRRKWAEAKRDPVTQEWSRVYHPLSVAHVLRGQTFDMPGIGNTDTPAR